jgi:hypothetical protein
MPRPTELTYSYSPYTVEMLETLLKNNQLELSPSYQRKSVWGPKDRTRLIETVLNGWPLPAIFLYKHRSGNRSVYQVIDGKQRLESVFFFMGAIKGGKFEASFEIDEDVIEKVDWKRLEDIEEAHRILEYKFHVVEVDGNIGSILRLFVDINSTGKALSAAEKRKALFSNSPILAQSERLAKSFADFLEGAKVVSKAQALRMKDIEMMCELLASAHRGNVLDKKESLNAVMGKEGANEREAKDAASQVRQSLQFIRTHFGDLAATRFHRKSDFYSLAFELIRLRADGYVLDDKRRADQAWALLRQLSDGVDHASKPSGGDRPTGPAADLWFEYLATVKEGTDAKSKRDRRGKIIRGVIESLFQRKDERRLFSDLQKRLLWNATSSPHCEECGMPITSWDDFEADHRFPHSRGGSTSIENAALTHKVCNRRKSDRA